jgi:hypothetical protein
LEESDSDAKVKEATTEKTDGVEEVKGSDEAEVSAPRFLVRFSDT